MLSWYTLATLEQFNNWFALPPFREINQIVFHLTTPHRQLILLDIIKEFYSKFTEADDRILVEIELLPASKIISGARGDLFPFP